MFGPLGIPELLFIFALALLIFGPRELPRIGRTVGKAMAEFRKASTELRRTLNTELLEEELRQNDPRRVLNDAAKDLRDSVEKAGAEPSQSAKPSQAADEEASKAGTEGPQVRVPAGQLARGELTEEATEEATEGVQGEDAPAETSSNEGQGAEATAEPAVRGETS